MAAPGRVGVIADDTLQGHLLAGAIKGQGYRVVVNTDPEHLEDRWLAADALDLWVVDLSREDRWQRFLDGLLENAAAPLLFCDGQAPARTADHYPRWERRLMTKLVGYIGAPGLEENLAAVPQTPLAAPIPELEPVTTPTLPSNLPMVSSSAFPIFAIACEKPAARAKTPLFDQ